PAAPDRVRIAGFTRALLGQPRQQSQGNDARLLLRGPPDRRVSAVSPSVHDRPRRGAAATRQRRYQRERALSEDPEKARADPNRLVLSHEIGSVSKYIVIF